MIHKISILALVLLALAMAMVGIGGAVAASAATTPASLAWAPTTSLGTYDYGTLSSGATKSVTFTLTNVGGKATGSLTITLSGPSAFTLTQNGCTGRSLGPNKSCTDAIEYAPQSSGQSASATLDATGKSTSASLTLTGTSGVGGSFNLTISPGTFEENTNGTNVYIYEYPTRSHVTQTFTVTNSGTSASEKLVIECVASATGDCDPPFTLTQDTCTNTSLAANGGSCTFDLEVTIPGNCLVGQRYSTALDVVGTGVTYITLFANVACPG
jgi:hypothetical protein